MFDNTCKFLAENFSEDFASWLLGESIAMTQLSPSELSLEPIRADSLILLSSEDFILHIEFQVEPDPTMPFRMADYRLRLYRRFPHKRVRQVVIYLTRSASEYVYQTAFEIPGTRHEFEVIRLWEQPTQPFLESTGLLPLAVLTQTADTAQTLRQVATRVDSIPEMRTQSNVAASAGILAGLLLERDFINRVLRKDIMQQSVIYQDILQEGEQRGRTEGERSLVLRQLARRVGTLPAEAEAQVQALTLPQLEALGEALLDFTGLDDLTDWLQGQ
jgi:predicted transposase/invertase (TIGR01784 family)